MKKVINIFSIHVCPWLRQFPGAVPEWGEYRFIFNAMHEPYDYLVVFDDLPLPLKPYCAIKNTIHIATEPPSVRCYEAHFLNQFAWVVTQDPHVSHVGKILHQPGLTWFIGWTPDQRGADNALDFEVLKNLFYQPRSKLISVIASNKAFTPEHKARLLFAQQLKKHYGDKLDFYGRGFVPMRDKLDALKDYRFQIVLENSSYDHYFSEKLTDCLIAGTYPIYYGCPNLHEYFPKNAYVSIDIHDFEGAITAIDQAIADNRDQHYRHECLEARDKALYEHNIFPMLTRLIERIEQGCYGKPHAVVLHYNKIQPFASKIKRYLRTHLNPLAHQYSFFRGLRRFYRSIRFGG